MIQNSLYTEKYRSGKLEEYIADDNFREKLASYIEKNDLPHLIFYGSPGTGKTTIAKLLANNIDSDCIYINAADEKGIDTVRDKIIKFASAASFKTLKLIILDEASHLMANAQFALLNVIETHSAHTRFILTGNYLEKLIPQLRSRLVAYPLTAPPKPQMAQRVAEILEKENVEYKNEDVASIINTYYPDMRKVINEIQNSSSTGKLIINEASFSQTYLNDIINCLSKPNKESWKNIRQIIIDNGIRDFSDVYRELYERFNNNGSIIIYLAEYQYKDNFVLDKELNFAACAYNIINELNKK